MSPERWKRIKDVAIAAMELSPEDRAQWLEQECGSDSELRRTVEALLADSQRSGRMIEEPLAATAAQLLGSLDHELGQVMLDQTISHYKIVEKLGEGGMGVVYKAEDTKLKRPVALKFLAPQLLSDEESRQRFLREAQAAAALDHPNICTVHEIDEVSGRTFIAMAFLEGRPLSERIKEGPLKLPEALSIAIQMAEGLEAAHARGITHRDIKPDNVMLISGSRGLVKLVDFGLAQLAGRSKFTREGTTLGTVGYMSPEQAEGSPAGQATDIWSLGIVLYEMIAGRRPFRGSRDQAIVYWILNEPPDPLTAVRTDVPRELERIVNKCLAKQPEQRYHHMDELLADLQAVRQELEPKTSRMAAAPPSAKPTSPAIQRRTGTRWGYILAGSALGLITSVAIWFGVTGRPPAAPRVVPLTSFPGSESHPSFSPDGSQVAFSWVGEAQDNFDIYVKLIGPGGTLRLTTDAAADRSPAWSPDGQQIAFLRELGDGNAAVVLVPPIGGTERRIAEIQIPVTRDAASAYFGTSLAWSPDGKYLAAPDFDSPDSRPVPAFDSLDSRPGIFLLSIQESQKRRLTLPPPQAIDDRRPAFSPDGRTLAFQRYSASAVTHLYTVPVAGGEPKRLTSFNGQPRGLTWTADGIEIIYTRGLELWRIPAAGGEARRLLGVVGNAGEPVISATGNRLAYSHRQRDLNIWGLETGAAGTSQPSQLIASTRRDSGPQFSPDGGRIAFWSDRSGSPEIWVCDRNGSNVLQLTSFRGPHTGTPRWSPNGQHLVFDSRVDGNPEIMTITSSGSSLRRLTNHEAEDNVPSWSADGRWIYFASNRSGEMQVWKLPAGGGAGEDAAAVQVTQNGGFAPFESPDGKNVYYAKTRGAKNAIWRVPVGGGAESPVIDSINSGWGHWALTGEGIYFVDREDPASLEQPWEIKSYRFADGRILKIADFHETLAVEDSGLSVSPDGRWLLCVGAESESDLMLLENFR